MFGLIKPRPPVDEDEFDWLVACFAWLLRHLDDGKWPTQAELVRPTDRFFPRSNAEGHAYAQELFEQVKLLCGMAEWPCRLSEGERRRDGRLQRGVAIVHEQQAPLGTFSVNGDEVFITYDPALLANPHQLVATFAHELAHYLIASLGDPPGGADLHEHATDCAAVYLGFGIFLANCSFQFSQFHTFDETGWESQRAGYLSEPALVTATALFVHFAGLDPAEAEAALKANLRKPFRQAFKVAASRFPSGSADLAAIDLAEWA